MVLTSPRSVEGGAAGKVFCVSSMILSDLGGDAAEVALVDVGVDVEDGLDVVVVDDDGGCVAAEGGEVAEQLRGVAAAAR